MIRVRTDTAYSALYYSQFHKLREVVEILLPSSAPWSWRVGRTRTVCPDTPPERPTYKYSREEIHFEDVGFSLFPRLAVVLVNPATASSSTIDLLRLL